MGNDYALGALLQEELSNREQFTPVQGLLHVNMRECSCLRVEGGERNRTPQPTV